MNLRLDWCSHEAAVYAVRHWHYAKTMPMGRLVKVGVWEDERFIGCVVFAQGNNQHHGKAFGLTQFQVCELVRVALRTHHTPVSRIVAIALSFLKRYCSGVRLVVSYADPAHGHVGGIYQAGNWVYVGTGGSSEAFIDATGKRLHSRGYSPLGAKIQFGAFAQVPHVGTIRRQTLPLKYKYFFAFDPEIRATIARLAQPYPKRVRSAESGTASPLAGGGVNPTRTLQSEGGDAA
jgi:hypothetical protein